MTIREANIYLVQRYCDIIKDKEFKNKIRIETMCEYILENHLNDISLDKLNNWVGFIQGVLHSEEIIDIAKEKLIWCSLTIPNYTIEEKT